jgi:hypothetical protein
MTRLIVCLALIVTAQIPCAGQSTPFLTDDQIRMLANEISGDRAFEHIRWLSHWHRDSGMEGYFKAAEYVVRAAKEAGLEDVRFVEQTRPAPSYTAREAELWMVEPVDLKLADIGEHAVSLADGSHSADVKAELVWVGDASPERIKGLDLNGKVVLTSAPPNYAAHTCVWERGAAGLVSFSGSEGKGSEYPDQIAWSRIDITPPAGKKGTFAFMISPRKGDTLRRILETKGNQDLFGSGKTAPGGRIVVKAKVVTEIGSSPSRTGFVEGWIRGSKIHDQQIVITAHLQEEQGSANDDGSGCANILEIARAVNKLIREGKMPRPERDIRFWWTDEIYSEYRYFRDNPGEPKKLLVNLHQDMTGANQAMGSRVQHLILAPHSITSYLDTIFQSFGTFLIHTNNGYLAASRQGGFPRPFTRPLFATRGTRQGYNAQFVPYFDSSDHMCFVEGAIGVPAVALVNWDDPFIHSSDDDLFQIDQTQLRRNAFLIALMAFYLSFAGEEEVPLLASETYALGAERLGKDLRTAVQHLHENLSDPAAAWKRALAILDAGVQREIRAVRSIKSLARQSTRTDRIIDSFITQLDARHKSIVRDLTVAFRARHGSDPKRVELTAEEDAASRKIPANTMPLETYFANRDKVRYRGNLHGLMRDEIYNFVDGKRSYYDIYKSVFAESAAAGSWYYGTVTLKDVTALLDAAVEAGALQIKSR